MKRKKPDGRRNNGRPATVNGEAQTVVRGPLALLDGMRAEAARQGIPLAEVWRRAAAAYLASR